MRVPPNCQLVDLTEPRYAGPGAIYAAGLNRLHNAIGVFNGRPEEAAIAARRAIGRLATARRRREAREFLVRVVTATGVLTPISWAIALNFASAHALAATTTTAAAIK